eukprot:403359813
MSYQSDHMAWQQRVFYEMNAFRRQLDGKIVGDTSAMQPGQSFYDIFTNYMKSSRSREGLTSSQVRKRNQSYTQYPFTVKNKQAYAFGGNTGIRQNSHQHDFGLNTMSSFNLTSQDPLQKSVSNYNTLLKYQNQNKNNPEDELKSQTSKSYIGKRKLQSKFRTKSMSNVSHHSNTQRVQANSNTKDYNFNPNQTTQTFYNDSIVQQDGNMQVYVPIEYFKRTGYIPSQTNPTQIQRFNEDLQDDSKSMISRKSQAKSIDGTHSQAKIFQRPSSAYNKQRILDKISKMSEDQIEKLSQTLNFAQNTDLAENQVTIDQLKKYNEINGFQDGPATDENLLIRDNDSNSKSPVKERERKGSKTSRSRTINQSIGGGSIKSSKTYISNLEQKLNEERKAREQLQQEIEQIKLLNTEIASKIGLQTKQ